jgi:N-methylhydantoinase A
VHTVRVPVTAADLGADDGGERIIDRFTELYEGRYGRGTAYRKAGVEAMTFVVEGVGALPLPVFEPTAEEASDPLTARIGERAVFFAERDDAEPVPVYDAERLRPGHEVIGPALVDAEDTTVLVGHGHRLWVDPFLNLRLSLEAR